MRPPVISNPLHLLLAPHSPPPPPPRPPLSPPDSGAYLEFLREPRYFTLTVVSSFYYPSSFIFSHTTISLLFPLSSYPQLQRKKGREERGPDTAFILNKFGKMEEEKEGRRGKEI